MLRALFAPLFALLWKIRNVLFGLLLIGLPVFLYLIASDEPVFSVEDDVMLGRQSEQSINESPEEFPVLSREEYPEAYARVQTIVDRIVESPAVEYEEVFQYHDVRLIHDDEVLNAFCAPGGFVYVYTGLIRYLDQEDDLAGVLGHEIAHAEKRHSSLGMQREYGAQRLLDLFVLGAAGSIGDVVAASVLNDLLGLRYSRGQEAEADAMSVEYLADTDYACDGAASFFEKLLAEGDDVGIPAWLSDHPDSQARVDAIRAAAAAKGCSVEPIGGTGWAELQASLPPLAGSAAEPDESGGPGA